MSNPSGSLHNALFYIAEMNGPVTVAPTQSPQDDDDDDGDTSDMDTLYSVIGAIAGALLVTILVILVFVWCRRSKYDRVGAMRNRSFGPVCAYKLHIFTFLILLYKFFFKKHLIEFSNREYNGTKL